MLEELITYEQYVKDNKVTVKKISHILKDGIEISTSILNTKTICPGDDYSNEDAITIKMCKSLHTKSVVDEYKSTLESAILE